MHSEQSIRVSFSIFKPQEGCNMDDVVAQMVAAAASIEKCSSSRSDISIYILRTISKNWAAAVAEKRGEEDANPWLNLPEAAAFTKGFSSAVRMVDSGWFDMNCEESKLGLPAFRQKRVGDVVSVRRIYSGGKNPDKLSYCCLALLKAYFTKTKGLHSYTFYDSMDGKRIIGLAKWESVDAACSVLSKQNGCSAEAFWRSLGAKKLKYDVCRVVYASKED